MDTIRLFNIQRYSVHDGNGIRTNIFLKGCPLSCIWCANPESQRFEPENVFSNGNCMKCRGCVNICPTGALTAVDELDLSKCIQCRKCERVCPTGARKFIGKDWVMDDVIDEVLKDDVFYKKSKGGVTLTGGEPLGQPKAAAELAAGLKKVGLHLAIETCGYASWEKAEPVLRHCDQILFDIKEMDSDKHKEFTGVGNELILSNARKAAALDSELIIRVPVIGGYNNDMENIRATAQFAAEIGAAQLHLLPFHPLGESKYEKSGLEYTCTAYTPDEQEMNRLLETAQACGIKSQIGG